MATKQKPKRSKDQAAADARKEDRVLLRVAVASKGEPRMKAAEFLKELGYGLDGRRS
jgi:hypothetical protein